MPRAYVHILKEKRGPKPSRKLSKSLENTWKGDETDLSRHFRAGSRCLEQMLGPTSLQASRIKQLREDLVKALEAQSFDARLFVEPLWRLNSPDGQAFTELLSLELARLIRQRGADEETEKEHEQKKLHELARFEDRERFRQLRLNRLVVTRCKQLKQRHLKLYELLLKGLLNRS